MKIRGHNNNHIVRNHVCMELACVTPGFKAFQRQQNILKNGLVFLEMLFG